MMARALAAALLLLGLVACGGQQTQVDEDRGLAASGLSSFNWRSAPLQATGRQQRSLIFRADPLIRKALEQGFARRGYQPVAARGQLQVDYRVMRLSEPAGDGALSPREQIEQGWDGPGAMDNPTAFYNHPSLATVETVTLLVTVFDAANGTLLWQGRSSQRVDDMEPGDAELERLVRQLGQQLERILPVSGG